MKSARWIQRWALALLLAAVGASPASAQVCNDEDVAAWVAPCECYGPWDGPDECRAEDGWDDDWEFDSTLIWAAAISFGVAVSHLVFVELWLWIEGIDKAANRGHGFNTFGTVVEVFWWLAHWGAAAAYSVGAASSPAGEGPVGWAVGAAMAHALVGAYHLVHAAWSFGHGPPPPSPEDPQVGFAPLRGGALVTLGGRR